MATRPEDEKASAAVLGAETLPAALTVAASDPRVTLTVFVAVVDAALAVKALPPEHPRHKDYDQDEYSDPNEITFHWLVS